MLSMKLSSQLSDILETCSEGKQLTEAVAMSKFSFLPEKSLRASTHYALYGRSSLFSCFISCLLFKDKFIS
jgi:hypothetical protein